MAQMNLYIELDFAKIEPNSYLVIWSNNSAEFELIINSHPIFENGLIY